MPLCKYVYCVAVTFIMTEWVEQQICIKFCVKIEHSYIETIQVIQKATAIGNWWLAASSKQCTCSVSCLRVFCKTSNHPGDSVPLQPRSGALWFLAFPKSKSPLKGKRSQTVSEIQENITGQLMEIGRTVWSPKVLTLKGTEASLSYVQCLLFLVFSSVNVSTFHITWLDTFWTDHIHKIYFYVIYNVLFKAYRKIRYRIHNCRTSGQDGSIGRHGSPLHTITSEL